MKCTQSSTKCTLGINAGVHSSAASREGQTPEPLRLWFLKRNSTSGSRPEGDRRALGPCCCVAVRRAVPRGLLPTASCGDDRRSLRCRPQRCRLWKARRFPRARACATSPDARSALGMPHHQPDVPAAHDPYPRHFGRSYLLYLPRPLAAPRAEKPDSSLLASHVEDVQGDRKPLARRRGKRS